MAAEYRTLSGRIFSASGPTAGARLAFSIVDDRGRPAMAASGIPGLVLMGTVGDVETDVDGAFSVDVIPTVGRNFRYMLARAHCSGRSAAARRAAVTAPRQDQAVQHSGPRSVAPDCGADGAAASAGPAVAALEVERRARGLTTVEVEGARPAEPGGQRGDGRRRALAGLRDGARG